MKTKSMFNTPELFARLRKNVETNTWAAGMAGEIVGHADFWRSMSDEEVWSLMFGPTIKRAWHVWSDGNCPVCGESVPMYEWVVDAANHPWKVGCPHCKGLFPKNDFYAYYQSGLDEKGVFSYELADKALLFNAEHPDPQDPLHMFCVDDGTGYADPEGKGRWWFIAAYLIYGQWKELVLGGISALASAYRVTGDSAYSRKALIMLDRVADLYPSFDFHYQGVMYDEEPTKSETYSYQQGFISYTVDSCPEYGSMTEAYDWVFDGAKDPELIAFLSQKAAELGLENPKDSAAKVCENIETNILQVGLDNPLRIACNFPATDVTLALAQYILDGDEEGLFEAAVRITTEATEVDGLTGEKGMTGYASFPLGFVAAMVQKISLADEGFLGRLLERVPSFKKTFLFHMNTLCLGRYYPQVGDDTSFAKPFGSYAGMQFTKSPGVNKSNFFRAFNMTTSMYSFFDAMYQATGDPAYIQIIALENGIEPNMPYDMFCPDPADFRSRAAVILEEYGRVPKRGSINYEQWRLALLRGGKDNDGYVAWVHYDNRPGHAHCDGMNLGLFAHGLDLLPDFGYPPVQFGGWASEKSLWYGRSAAHNTALVDKKDLRNIGEWSTTLWHTGKAMQAVTIDGCGIEGVQRYQRSVALVPVGQDDFYLVDIFRIRGGARHDLFLHSQLAELSFTPNLTFAPAGNYDKGVLVRDIQSAPGDGDWVADFAICDEFKLVAPDADIHLRCHGLTGSGTVSRAEGWTSDMLEDMGRQVWVPFLIQTREGDGPLESCFVSVIEACAGGRPVVADVRRTDPGTDMDVALEISLAGGRRDVFTAEDGKGLVLKQFHADGRQTGEEARPRP